VVQHDLNENDCMLFVKNVPTYFTAEAMQHVLEEKYSGIRVVQRQFDKRFGRPLPVIKLSCSKASAERLLSIKRFYIGGHRCIVSRNIVAGRCYNCHRFGHAAKICSSSKRCINCGDQHSDWKFYSKPANCANCQGPHKASFKGCPVYCTGNNMKILQANVRSLNTSKYLMEITTWAHCVDKLLLQEVWTVKFNPVLRDFMPPIMKLRDNKGDGVAILHIILPRWFSGRVTTLTT